MAQDIEDKAAETPAKKPSRLKGILKDLAIIAIFWVVISAWQENDLLPRFDGPAPDFTLQTLDGETISRADLAGESVLLHFWASWCGVCRQEFGTLNQMADDLPEGQRLVTVIVSSGREDEIARFVEKHDLNYTILIDKDAVSKTYKVSSLPTNYFLSDEGEVISRTVGYTPELLLRLRLHLASLF